MSARSEKLESLKATVMTNLVPRTDMTFAGTFEPVCYAEVKNVGKFKPDQTERISGRLCELLTKALGVECSRISHCYKAPYDLGYLWGFSTEKHSANAVAAVVAIPN